MPCAAEKVVLSLVPDDVLTAREGIEGYIVRWDDARGFGFIRVDCCDTEVFFHISAFAYVQQRPQLGASVVFTAVKTDEGWRATRVTLLQDRCFLLDEHCPDAPAPRLCMPQWTKIWQSLAFGGIWLYWSALCSPVFLMIDVILSLLTFCLYRQDKVAALQNRWRIRESTLHFWAFLGGWPGALLARYIFRHKTKKKHFVLLFWLGVLLNVGVLIYLIVFQSPLIIQMNTFFYSLITKFIH